MLQFPEQTDWHRALTEELSSDNFIQLQNRYQQEKQKGKNIFPSEEKIFLSLEKCSLADTKVVMLGQDPYHRPGQAMGLSFSVSPDAKIPPSLRNIYKELKRDLGLEIPSTGDLSHWAEQGVLLLNSVLTVEEGQAGSHRRWGWQVFTDAIINKISSEKTNVVFMLWGKYAQSKKKLIDASKHQVLEAAHPSPLALNQYSGCAHFSECNQYLVDAGLEPILW